MPSDPPDDTDPSELDYIERVQYWRDDVPAGYEEAYERLLGRGRSPRHAAGIIAYVAGQLGDTEYRTQTQVSVAYDMSHVTIREHYGTVAKEVAAGATTEATMPSKLDKTAGEIKRLVEALADSAK